jgi:NADPH:quinone reductase-like Zn-dependent oxidoreductase
VEFAGVVEAVGAEVAEPAVGDRVFGVAGGGAQAAYLAVPAGQCAPVPDGCDLVEMGGIPEVFITAHDAMVTRANCQPGEWVLVHAAGSGVGTAAIQLAKSLGAQVIGTARTTEKLERCRALGLDAGVVPVRAGDDLDTNATVAAILDATKRGVDVTLDLVGGSYVEVDVDAAAVLGRIVLIGALAGPYARLSVVGAMGKRLTIVGTVLRARSVQEKAEATAAFTRDVVPLLAAGTLRPVIDRVLPLAAAEAAYDALASDTTFGKVILDCTT